MYVPSLINIINDIYRYGLWTRIFMLGDKAFITIM